uniref:glucan endo-1,3-beta-D-glucosidase n=1 Tax=Araucaria cunninghamii TaxID=56994 RepID=A0A0D6QXP6_ARACU
MTLLMLLLASSLLCMSLTVEAIGVNYGTLGDNLPPPSQVAKFLQSTSIDRVKLFGADPSILQALANTEIGVVVAVANDEIVGLAKLPAAQEWVNKNVVPYMPATKIIAIAVGNEVLSTGDKNLIAHLVPAMQNLHTALAGASLDKQVKVSTPHSLGIMAASEPPSIGRFRRGYDKVIIKPMLSFLRTTGAPFMINPYPYFGFTDKTLNYALFKPNPGVYDTNTKITYTNMFEAQLDAVYSAMKLLGFPDVDIVVAETGWPSFGDIDQPAVNMENAISYNGNLIKFVTSGVGTPLMPNRTFDTYIFALFNEDLKPGSTAERNFGLFKPDMTQVYDVGLMKAQSASPAPVSAPVTPTPTTPTTPVPVTGTQKYWCVAKPDVDERTLQSNIDYACGQGIDCTAIQPGGACYDPNTITAHATYAMNAYYQASGRNTYDCDFSNTGLLTQQDPSYGECVYKVV